MARGQLRIPSGEAAEEGGEAEPSDHVARGLEALGLSLEGELDVEEEFYLWPSNLQAFELWQRLQSQWLYAEGHPVGLNYAGVEAAVRLIQIPNRRRAEMFSAMQVMEFAALDEWAKQR